MSQVVKIKRLSFRGTKAYIGDRDGKPQYSGHPERVAQWMCDGFRTRFNQHRSQRSKYVYDPDTGTQKFNDDGTPMLALLGNGAPPLTDKEAREQFSYLRALPAMVLQAPTRIEAKEWFSAAKRRKTSGGSMPGFRSKKRGDNRFVCWHNKGANASFARTGRRSGMLTIRGQNPPGAQLPGRWELRFHVVFSQKIREYTSVCVDLSKRTIVFTSPPPTVDRSHAGGIVGIDRGVTITAATSDGEVFTVPDTTALDDRIKSLQAKMARQRLIADAEGRSWRDSKRYQETKRLCARAHRQRSGTKITALHTFTTRIAKTYREIVLEVLKPEEMSKKGKGKRGLNRGIRDARWATLNAQLQYKTGHSSPEAKGTNTHFVHEVNPRHTSQRCSNCGFISKENRESQSVFVCKRCGFTANADTNAANNILARFLEGWISPPWSKDKTNLGTAQIRTCDEAKTSRTALSPSGV